MRRSGFANGPVYKTHLHVIPHRALGQIGEGAEFIKAERFGHGSILTLKLFKSSVIKYWTFNLIGVRSTLISLMPQFPRWSGALVKLKGVAKRGD